MRTADLGLVGGTARLTRGGGSVAAVEAAESARQRAERKGSLAESLSLSLSLPTSNSFPSLRSRSRRNQKRKRARRGLSVEEEEEEEAEEEAALTH